MRKLIYKKGDVMKKMIVVSSILAIGLAMSGCASKYMAKKYSTGAIGCVSDEIMIEDEKLDMLGYTTWVATCKGQRYICSHLDDEGTNCKEESK